MERDDLALSELWFSFSVVTPTYSQTASASISCDFAINAAVPGKFSLLKSGGGTGSLYFNGTKVADLTTTDDSDMKELSYTSTTAGTFVYVSGSTSNVAALTDYDYTNAADPIYVLAQIDDNTAGFKKFTGTSIAQYKAYLQFGTVTQARAFRLVYDDTTDIVTLPAENADMAKKALMIYSVSGTLQSGLKKGVNIVVDTDGTVRKVTVK